MCASLVVGADELIIAGKSAQDAFKDEGVVKLLKAVIHSDSSEAKRLIAGGVNVNAIGEGGITPLLWVELNRNVNAMQLLLDQGADPNKYVPGEIGEISFGPPVWMAAGAGQKKILQILLDHGGDPNLGIGGKSPMMMAISESHLDSAELLLQHGADINYSSGPMSALFTAMVHAQFADAIWVLKHGYTHDLSMGRQMLASKTPRPGQEAMKAQALEIIDRLLAAQKRPAK